MATGRNRTQRAPSSHASPQLCPAARLGSPIRLGSLPIMLNVMEAVRRALQSPAFKFFLVCVLILLLLLPLLLVNALVWEREDRAQAVRAEVGRTWGPEQQVLGPFLVVPYTVRLTTVQGDKRIEQLQERRAV